MLRVSSFRPPLAVRAGVMISIILSSFIVRLVSLGLAAKSFRSGAQLITSSLSILALSLLSNNG